MELLLNPRISPQKQKIHTMTNFPSQKLVTPYVLLGLGGSADSDHFRDENVRKHVKLRDFMSFSHENHILRFSAPKRPFGLPRLRPLINVTGS